MCVYIIPIKILPFFFGKLQLPKRWIPVTHWSLKPYTFVHTHMYILYIYFCHPVLCEVAANVQGLLVHLSHILQVTQQREAAIVPWGAFGFGTAAKFGTLERGCCLETLEVGELQQVFSRHTGSDVRAVVVGGGVPLCSTKGGGGQRQNRTVLAYNAGWPTLTAGQARVG